MPDKIDPDLFARLMGLSHPVRKDLLEFLGQTPVAEAELERLVEDVSARTDKKAPKLS